MPRRPGRSVTVAGPARPGRWPRPGGGRCGDDAGAADAGQARQDPFILKPAQIRGMVQQDRLAGGGADRAGARDRVTHQCVDQGRFSGSGGTADHGEQGRVQAAVARNDVVVELGHGVPEVQAGLLDAGQAERERRGSEVVPDRFQQGNGARGPRRRRATGFAIIPSGAHSIIMPVQRGFRAVSGSARSAARRQRAGKRTRQKRPRADARDRFIGDPSGIRTRVTAVRGQRTRPLYDGAVYFPERRFRHSSQMIVSYTWRCFKSDQLIQNVRISAETRRTSELGYQDSNLE